MRSPKRLLIPVAFSALVGLSVPADAAPPARPSERVVAGASWGPLVPVPIPARRTYVHATAISDLGHIAVAYTVSPRGGAPIYQNVGYVIVRGPQGVWGAPHRLNPSHTGILDVQVAFDARGNLTVFWRVAAVPGLAQRYAVATKPDHRRWTGHVRVGTVSHDPRPQELVLSVAPSGKAVIGWRQFVEALDEFQFTVRVRQSAGGVWGPARSLSAVSNLTVEGDTAINDHGTAVAAWTACQPWPAQTCKVQRSTLTRSGAWTTPTTIGRSSPDKTKQFAIGVASTPSGFTAITWRRLPDDKWWTVVDLRTAGGIWSRDVVHGSFDSLAVGPHRTVVIQDWAGVRWRTNRSGWNTWSAPSMTIRVFAPAVDSTGRIFVATNQKRGSGIPQEQKGFMATHLSAWKTTGLWDWATDTWFAASAVSSNGRAAAIRTVSTPRGRPLAVQMRVLRPD
jgi:hypothetical protein